MKERLGRRADPGRSPFFPSGIPETAYVTLDGRSVGMGGFSLRSGHGPRRREVPSAEIGLDVPVGLGSAVGEGVAFGEGPPGAGVEEDLRPAFAPVAVGVGGAVGGRHLAMEAAGVGPPEAPYPLMGGLIARAGLPGSDHPGLPDHKLWACEESRWQGITPCSGLSCPQYEERR